MNTQTTYSAPVPPQLRVAVVGGLGLMASPMARHWAGNDSVRVVGVHDRGSPGPLRENARLQWRSYGAPLRPELSEVVVPNTDGVFVCAGKNGDDLKLLARLVAELQTKGTDQRFICHLSTVSAGFAMAAERFCLAHGVRYVNYPLTGGPLGAEKGTMLILASGDAGMYELLEPRLLSLGKPKYFGERVSAGAEVKLIGHLMVFNGLMGVSSAIATHSECFANGMVGGPQQTEFFDYLNAGAGGTKQWDLIARSGISDDIWDRPFLAEYAAVDALYAADLCREKKVADIITFSVIDVALCFSYLLNIHGTELATHAIVREMIRSRAEELNVFLRKYRVADDPMTALARCEASLPPAVRERARLHVTAADFEQEGG